MRITDGVFALQLEVEMEGETRTFNPAVFELDDGIALVDVGLPGMAEALESQLDEHGYGFDDVRLILATHQDADHIGALPEARHRTDATVMAHEADVPSIVGDAEPIKVRGERPPPAPVDLALVGGETLRTEAGDVGIVHTPGHTPGHLSLYVPDARLLLAADALVGEGEQLAGPIDRATPDMATAIRSVGELAELDVDRTLCFHGGLVGAGSERIREIYDDRRGE